MMPQTIKDMRLSLGMTQDRLTSKEHHVPAVPLSVVLLLFVRHAPDGGQKI